LKVPFTLQLADHNEYIQLNYCCLCCWAPGFVIRFENGEMYKIKTAWYCDLNKTLDLVSRSRSQHGSEMDVWKVILEGTCVPCARLSYTRN
jgi:hypothetical protein